jgi:hypothetical protein
MVMRPPLSRPPGLLSSPAQYPISLFPQPHKIAAELLHNTSSHRPQSWDFFAYLFLKLYISLINKR